MLKNENNLLLFVKQNNERNIEVVLLEDKDDSSGSKGPGPRHSPR